MRVRPLLVLTAAMAALLPVAAAGATGPIEIDEIVYVHHDGEQYDLWTVDAGGVDARPLPSAEAPAARTTNHTGLEHMPVLSPDGRYLAFEARYPDDGEDAGVYVQDLSSGLVTQVAGAAGRYEGPTDWYTDDAGGQHLVFIREKPDGTSRYDAYEILVDGTARQPRQLTNLRGSVMSVKHDAGRLVYQFGAEHAIGGQQICTTAMPSGSKPATRHSCLTKGAADMHPTVASNGDVVFVRQSKGKYSLMRLAGSQISALPTPSSFRQISSPAFSPDGTSLAFAATESDHAGLDLWLMPSGGGVAVALVTTEGPDYFPTWRRGPQLG